MKKFSAPGLAATTVLVAAFLGGIAGGAVVLSDDGSEPQARPVQMGLKVADEATDTTDTTTDAATAGAAPAPAATLEVEAPAPAAPAPVQEEPVATSPTETAQEAADRAEKAARRAEDAAEKVTPTPSPSPVAIKPTPVPPTVEAPASACSAGEVRHIGRWDEQICKGGQWTSAAPNRHCKVGGAEPTYLESGTTTKRTSGGMEFTYRCEDGQLTLVDES